MVAREWGYWQPTNPSVELKCVAYGQVQAETADPARYPPTVMSEKEKALISQGLFNFIGLSWIYFWRRR